MGLLFALVLIGAFTAAAYYDLTSMTGGGFLSMEPSKPSKRVTPVKTAPVAKTTPVVPPETPPHNPAI